MKEPNINKTIELIYKELLKLEPIKLENVEDKYNIKTFRIDIPLSGFTEQDIIKSILSGKVDIAINEYKYTKFVADSDYLIQTQKTAIGTNSNDNSTTYKILECYLKIRLVK